MSEGEVISFKTRHRIVTESIEEPVAAPEAPVVDEELLELAEYFLKKVKDGEITGGILIGWDKVYGLDIAHMLPPQLPIPMITSIFAGAAALVQRQMVDIMQESCENPDADLDN